MVFDVEAVTSLDTSGAQTLHQVVDELHGGGVRFVVASCRAAFQGQVDRLGITDVIPEANRFSTVSAAVQAVAGIDLGSPQTERLTAEAAELRRLPRHRNPNTKTQARPVPRDDMFPLATSPERCRHPVWMTPPIPSPDRM